MKKVLALLLAISFCFTLCACGGSKPVELTSDNIKDYITFDLSYGDVERETKLGMSFGYTTLTLKAYPTSSGTFENVNITVSVPLSNGWSVSSSDKSYNKADSETLNVTFTLPANGEFTETHNLIASLVYSNPNNQNISYTITNVTGTFIPN